MKHVQYIAIIAKDHRDYEDLTREKNLKDTEDLKYKYVRKLHDIRGVRWSEIILSDRCFENKDNYEIADKLEERIKKQNPQP